MCYSFLKDDKNINGTPKMQNFWFTFKVLIFQYCDSNIRLFSLLLF